jgi:lipopolysaccharide export system permease protein
MLEKKFRFEIAIYYYHFTFILANFFSDIFVFIIIWFTSKLANDTEIIAILSSGILLLFSETYIIGASIVSVFVLLMGSCRSGRK